MKPLQNKVLFITGASRGIGLAIAKRAAADGAKIIIAAKTTEPHPKLSGTIFTAAEEVKQAGGEAFPVVCDIREEESIKKAMTEGAAHFGGIDICVLNASAIYLTKTPETPSRRFDLMHGVIVRGSFLTVQHSLPYLQKSVAPKILALCPPLNLEEKWLAPYLAYSLAKFGLSMSVRGWAGEFKGQIDVNGLWPKTLIATAAVQNLLGGDAAIRKSRKPEIVADAAHWILTQQGVTGNHFLDEDIIKKIGRDPQSYAVDPNETPAQDIYV
ncbi:MAG: SDR family oxidoreductase [Pseudobdellovibrionaceae bacterium]